MTKNITFRAQLVGGVADFCHSTDLPILSDTLNLVELIVKLARYQEEGVKLCPKVYLCNKIERVVTLLPGGESLKIGCSSADVNGIKEALKKCAPLATDGWLVYIKNSASTIEYGLFRGPENPISVLVDDVVMTPDEDLSVVKVFQVGDECVEVRSNNGDCNYIYLDHRKESASPPLHYLDALVNSICFRALPEQKEPCISFLKRLLFESLRQSHGCLIAVTSMNRPPKFLSNDGVILDEAIDFPSLIRSLKRGDIPSSYLESKASLLRGMLNSDGVLLFDNSARILGYNCFVKTSQEAMGAGGGARKRAFLTLKSKIGRGLRSVFIQSQDGWSDYSGETYD
ncbi:hypothetical protein ACJO2E_10995 [Marinobacter sp. M1N3S26]|uniref:hypothetical protein n=1 Tax=Marinobacter sp. M1N3S26 TaxID=3382299 RepID=UPI00387A8D1A